MSFVLGINYPWVACGHDFGPRPPTWGHDRTDWNALERELIDLRTLGLTVVRYWLLGGGVNYPIGRSADEVADRKGGHFVLKGARPPELSRAFLEDFERLLLACDRARVRLVPSLVSFELFRPIHDLGLGVAAHGRAAFVLGRQQDAFLDAVLEPLLEVSERHRDALYAWEVANEPDWIAKDHPSVGELLLEGCHRIARRGFLSTIGFARRGQRWLSADAHAELADLAARGSYLHQIHFYPNPNAGRLPAAHECGIVPCLLGEMPTAQYGRYTDPELWSTEAEPDRYLEARIALAQTRGYAGALLWSRNAEDPNSRWDERVKAQVRRAARGL